MSIRLVRDVAPNKRMMRVTFRVPEAVAFGHCKPLKEGNNSSGGGERDSKRLRMSNEKLK